MIDPHQHAAPERERHAPAAPRPRGRRRTHAERWMKVTVVLFDRQIDFLDRLTAEMRASTGAAVSRAHVIRALVDGLAESDLDLARARSEGDLKEMLVERLGGGPGVGPAPDQPPAASSTR